MDENQIRKLTEYYISSYPNRKGLRISDVIEITAGWETKLYKYTINYKIRDKPVAKQYVIRVFSDDAASTSEKEFRVMMKLRDQGYPVPAVFHNEIRGNMLGKPFIIMEYLPGNTMDFRFHQVSDPEREKLFMQMIELFVDLHKVGVSEVFPENKLSDTQDHLTSFLNMIDEIIIKKKLDWVNPVVDWLQERQNDVENIELCIMHGDFHGGNILYRADGSPVVIDWSGAHVGDYRFDLAWTLILFSTFGGSFFRELLLNLYSEVSREEINDIEYFEVLNMGAAVRSLKEVEFFTRFKAITLPASVDAFLLAAFSDITERIAAVVPAGIFTAEFNHRPQYVIAFSIVLIGGKETHIGEGCGDVFEPGFSQFFSQVAGKVGDCPQMGKAVAAVEAAVGN